MKRIQWTAMLLGLLVLIGALTVPGCSTGDADKSDKDASAKQQSDEPKAPQPSDAGAGPVVPPPPPPSEVDGEKQTPPPGDSGGIKGGGKVAGAIGRALLKGLAGGSESDDAEPDDAGAAPAFQP